MKKAVFLLAVVLVLVFASVSQAGDVVYVDVNSPNDPGSGSVNDPFRRIQDAINDANDGDIVEIRPGIYTGDPNNYNLNPNGKSISIRSINPGDPSTVASTIIDPNGAGRGFYFHSGEDANCVLSGLTIRNGYTGGKGGGIYCYNSSPTITNCIISGNLAGTHGGGIFCQNSSPQIMGCVISGNKSANDGGGIEHWRGKSVVTNCIISDNLANGAGGGADYFDSNDVTLINCTLAKNFANSGGAVYCWGSSVIVKNSILWANNADTGPQIALSVSSASSILVSYSDVQGGEAAVYDPGNGLVWDNNNINTDPCFAWFDLSCDPNIWDFHLKSQFGRWKPSIYTDLDPSGDGFIDLVDFAALASFWQKQGSFMPADLDNSGLVDLADLRLLLDNYLAGYLSEDWGTDDVISLCIDAGDPNADWSDEPWPNGKRINMGAYGGTNQASKNGNIADFDVSGAVNLIDLMELSSKWLDEEAGIVNLDLVGCVDFADFALFADNWLWQKE